MGCLLSTVISSLPAVPLFCIIAVAVPPWHSQTTIQTTVTGPLHCTHYLTTCCASVLHHCSGCATLAQPDNNSDNCNRTSALHCTLLQLVCQLYVALGFLAFAHFLLLLLLLLHCSGCVLAVPGWRKVVDGWKIITATCVRQLCIHGSLCYLPTYHHFLHLLRV
jgi:hypothetical protein